MAHTQREIERKYEADDGGLPDLTGAAGIATVRDEGISDLDATYYDTVDRRLAEASITLRCRTGGSDAGWHLKFPVAPGVRDEIRAPLSEGVPADLAALVRSRVRGAELVPLVRLRSRRAVCHLLDADGGLLAEASVDAVRAERLTGEGGRTEWSEIEIELAEGGDPAFLDRVEKRLRKAGVRPSASASKLARALQETAPAAEAAPGEKQGQRSAGPPVTAGDHVLAYLRTQRDAVVAFDPAVRRDLPDAVHDLRVATRRLRGVLRSSAKVLDRTVTDPLRAELKWLAGELGADRDREVLTERLTAAVADLPDSLVVGPVGTRLDTWDRSARAGTRHGVLAALDSDRYLALLDALDALLADPPLRPAAARKPGKVIAKAVRKDFKKLSSLVGQALDLPPGQERDGVLHEARKKAKRTRYTAEAAAPAVGKRAEDLARALKSLQGLLGDHQDSVMARDTLRDLADQAHAAGESAFTYGLLYGREERRAERADDALPELWASIARATAL
ncbi:MULTISPECIES: CYTH and CHAD domain-containing protein [Streptomyces]|uniref:Metal-binding protein n=2 Tax=Streptomyces TaxID=1883 RepID=A0A2U9P128_STRAS|nr:CYTH and CHAD domain-containing protein [Streptomyces actuosus]AWT43232.1 metal-binding protein [Streptomyces actuosus]MBM4824609.1 CYTH and CHAD domain-containing protein [Streptomyces actuosus]